MANSRAFHGADVPLDSVENAIKFLEKSAGKKNDLTGIVIEAWQLRAIAQLLRSARDLSAEGG